jgi:hypothetical protein
MVAVSASKTMINNIALEVEPRTDPHFRAKNGEINLDAIALAPSTIFDFPRLVRQGQV